MPPVRSEPTISAGEQPQTYVLDRVARSSIQCLAKITWHDSLDRAVHTCTTGKFAAIRPTTFISKDEIEPLL